jgi:hypothetical protein
MGSLVMNQHLDKQVNNKKKKMGAVGGTRLALTPMDISMMAGITQTTVSVYELEKGTNCFPVDEIRERVSQIVKLNPWLLSRLVTTNEDGSSSSPQLWYPSNNASSEMSHQMIGQSFRVIEVNYLSHVVKYQSQDYVCQNGVGALNKENEALWKFTMLYCVTSKKYAIIMSMSHVLGDGATFYSILNMMHHRISSNSNKAKEFKFENVEEEGDEAEEEEEEEKEKEKEMMNGKECGNADEGVYAMDPKRIFDDKLSEESLSILNSIRSMTIVKAPPRSMFTRYYNYFNRKTYAISSEFRIVDVERVKKMKQMIIQQQCDHQQYCHEAEHGKQSAGSAGGGPAAGCAGSADEAGNQDMKRPSFTSDHSIKPHFVSTNDILVSELMPEATLGLVPIDLRENITGYQALHAGNLISLCTLTPKEHDSPMKVRLFMNGFRNKLGKPAASSQPSFLDNINSSFKKEKPEKNEDSGGGAAAAANHEVNKKKLNPRRFVFSLSDNMDDYSFTRRKSSGKMMFVETDEVRQNVSSCGGVGDGDGSRKVSAIPQPCTPAKHLQQHLAELPSLSTSSSSSSSSSSAGAAASLLPGTKATCECGEAEEEEEDRQNCDISGGLSVSTNWSGFYKENVMLPRSNFMIHFPIGKPFQFKSSIVFKASADILAVRIDSSSPPHEHIGKLLNPFDFCE